MPPVSKNQPAKPAGQVTLEDCLLILLRGIQNHSVIADGSDGQEFRAELAALESRFQGKENAHRLVDSAVEILDKYGAQTNQVIAQQKSELVTAAKELSEAVKTLPGIQRSAERLSMLEQQINAISAEDDLEVVKARLCADVAAARTEALQEGHKISALFSGVAGKLDIAPERAPGQMESEGASGAARPAGTVYAPDPLTGLPSRAYAEAELARAQGQSSDCYVALFVVKRLALINAKFGYSRGDQVLLKVVLHLAQSLPEFNNLLRWAPCAFITVAPPKTTYKELRSKIQIIELTRMAPTLEWEGRSAMVPVAIDCRIVSVKDFGTPYDLFLRLDTLSADA
jgi:GGDEF domain-containing protein